MSTPRLDEVPRDGGPSSWCVSWPTGRREAIIKGVDSRQVRELDVIIRRSVTRRGVSFSVRREVTMWESKTVRRRPAAEELLREKEINNRFLL